MKRIIYAMERKKKERTVIQSIEILFELIVSLEKQKKKRKKNS